MADGFVKLRRTHAAEVLSKGLTRSELAVWLAMLVTMDYSTNICSLWRSQLAKLARVDERSVSRATKSLERKGLIKRVTWRGIWGNGSKLKSRTLYRIMGFDYMADNFVLHKAHGPMKDGRVTHASHEAMRDTSDPHRDAGPMGDSSVSSYGAQPRPTSEEERNKSSCCSSPIDPERRQTARRFADKFEGFHHVELEPAVFEKAMGDGEPPEKINYLIETIVFGRKVAAGGPDSCRRVFLHQLKHNPQVAQWWAEQEQARAQRDQRKREVTEDLQLRGRVAKIHVKAVAKLDELQGTAKLDEMRRQVMGEIGKVSEAVLRHELLMRIEDEFFPHDEDGYPPRKDRVRAKMVELDRAGKLSEMAAQVRGEIGPTADEYDFANALFAKAEELCADEHYG